MAYTDEQINVAATAVRPQLEALLGPPANDVGADLDAMLVRAKAGETVANTILQLLWKHEPVRRWDVDY